MSGWHFVTPLGLLNLNVALYGTEYVWYCVVGLALGGLL